jgi:hypothetical protein
MSDFYYDSGSVSVEFEWSPVDYERGAYYEITIKQVLLGNGAFPLKEVPKGYEQELIEKVNESLIHDHGMPRVARRGGI